VVEPRRQLEVDIVAPLEAGGTLFGECKWSAKTPADTDVHSDLQRKVARIPEPAWLVDPSYILFSVGDFTDRLRSISANDPRIMLVDGAMLF
jgi:hypothetical protein